MFEKNEKLELLKELLGTREDYVETVKNLKLDKKEKEIFLLAFVHIKKKNIDQKLIDQAYDIVVKKSMDMDGADQNGDDGKVIEEVGAKTISNHDPSSNRKIQIPKNPRKTNLNYGLIFVVGLIIFFIYQKGFFGGGELQVIDASKLQDRNGTAYKVNETDPHTEIVEQPHREEVKPKIINISKLQDRNGTFYTVNETDPFTGIAEGYYSGKKEKRVISNGLLKSIIKWNISSGEKESESYTIDGEKHTMLIDWYESGQKKAEGNYIDGKRNGLYVDWYKNGQKNMEGNYIDGKKNGLLVYWYENGQKKFKVNYIDGKQNGLDVEWYKNGQKKVEANYIDGKRNGLYVDWYKNGQKNTEVNFINGKANGLGVEWHENGQKKVEVNFINGKANGLGVKWHENGQRKDPNSKLLWLLTLPRY